MASIPDESRTVGRGMARGAAWMVLMRLVMRGAGLINMMIMARLLVPEDFGLVAMAMIFVGAIEILSEFNFDVALIKEQGARRRHYDTAWTLSVIRGVVVALILVAIARPAAALFDEPRLEAMIAVLSLSSLMLGCQNIGVVDFRKSLDFRKDFLFMASEKVAAVAVTICLAFLWRDYWALVGGIVASKLWRVGCSYAMHPYRPSFCLAAWRPLFAFTKWLLFHNMLLFLRNRVDRLIIGKLLGATTLGLYTVAFELANLATSELMAPIRRALLPGYAKLADRPEWVRSMFIEVFGLTLWLGAPLAIGVGLIADPLVNVLLGYGWQAAVPVIQMLVIAGFVALLSSGSQPIYLALGRPELPTLLTALSVTLLIPGLIVGTRVSGMSGAVIAVVTAQTLMAIADIVLVIRLLGLAPRAIGAIAWRSLAALALMAVVVHAVVRLWPFDRSWSTDAGLLVSAILIGAATYVTTSLLLWHRFAAGSGPERHVMRHLFDRLAGLRIGPGSGI